MGGWTVAWTNPALVIGALGLLVPYLVHLLTKRTPRTLVFPTIQFLKRAQANQSAFFRLRDAILLLLRTAFVALLLLAFLKPVLRARAMTGEEDKQQAAIVVVDASLSMQYNDGAPFARAQQAVDKLLGHLNEDCVVNVVLAGASPTSSLEAPAASTAPLKRDLLTVAPTLERADVDAAIDEAVRQLQAFPNHARTIYLASDFQRTNWSAAKFSAVPEGIKLVFLPVSGPAASNVSITDVSIRPRTPVLSETVEVVCAVANYSAATVEVPVHLAMRRIASDSSDKSDLSDVSDESKKSIKLAPGASASVSFRFRAARIGSFEGIARVPDDGLAADNARYFTLAVHDRIDVLLVSDVAAEGRTGGHFTWRALDPYGGQNAGAAQRASTIRTRVVRARDLDLSTDPPQVLVVDGAGPLSETAIARIVEYLSNGGAAIYFLSDVLDKGNLDAFAFTAKERYVAPFSLTSMVNRRSDEDAAGTLAEVKLEDPIFRRFKESGEFAGLRFYRYFATERIQGRGEVLARFGDGNVAMGKATLGAGALLLCNFSAGRDASDLAQNPAFIPLVYEMIKSMRPREGAVGRAVVGYPASGSVSVDGNPTGLLFLAPSGKNVSAAADRHGQRLAAILPVVKEHGFYRINEGSLHLGSIPVNVDARESDLLPLTEAQLQELSASPRRKVASAAARDTRAIGALLEGVPIWPYLLLGALCLLGVEQFALLLLKK